MTAIDVARRAAPRRRRTAAVNPPSAPPTPRRWPVEAVALLVLVGFMVAIGLAMVLSASSAEALEKLNNPFAYEYKQLIAAAVGLVAMVISLRVPYQRWRNAAGYLLVAALGLMLLVVIPGNPFTISVNGASRWLNLGVTQFQPSELGKFALVVYAAAYLSSPQVRPPVDIRPILIVFGAFAVLAMGQPDFGTSVLAFVMMAVMVILGDGDRRTLGIASGVALLGGIAVSLGTAFRRERMLAFLNPWAHPRTSGYQTLQAQVGFASGGLFGRGIGSSKAKYGYLPEAHTDFIFAIFGEEFGLVGALVLLAMYLVVVALGLRVAYRCKDPFGRLMAAGITTWLGAQALINQGVATGALPNKGITLPFISYGGSSLIVTMFAAGVLINIARSNG